MKKNIFLSIFIALNILLSCKNNKDNSQNIENNTQIDSSHNVSQESNNVQLIKTKDTVNDNYDNKIVNLPFDYEYANKLSNIDKTKYLLLYPQLVGEKLLEIKKIISSNSEDNPDEIFQINNGSYDFTSYVYCTSGDSDSQTLINIKDNKIIATESVGYSMPEGNETYQSFVINKDLSINVYDVQYNSGTRKILEKHQIKPNGAIIKIK